MQPKSETCYGIIPLRLQEGQWHVLLLLHRKGNYWAFPKGHAEPGELPLQTATRELHEETGLTVKRSLSTDSLEEAYSFMRHGQLIHKAVHYFLAEVEGEIALHYKEILSSRWVKLTEASLFITFPQSKEVCEKAIALL